MTWILNEYSKSSIMKDTVAGYLGSHGCYPGLRQPRIPRRLRQTTLRVSAPAGSWSRAAMMLAVDRVARRTQWRGIFQRARVDMTSTEVSARGAARFRTLQEGGSHAEARSRGTTRNFLPGRTVLTPVPAGGPGERPR